MNNDFPIDLVRTGEKPVYQMPVNAEIQSLMIIDTGSYLPQARRPFVTHGDSQIVGEFLNNIGSAIQNNSSITPHMMSQAGGNLLTVSTQAEASSPIPNGWGTNRLRFVLTVKIHSQLGNDRVAYFQGYTDFQDNSYNGLIDPRSVFFINSFVVIDNITIPTPSGMMVAPRVVEASNILPEISPRAFSSPLEYNGQTYPIPLSGQQMAPMTYMRPNDVFMAIQTSHVADQPGIGQVYDVRSSGSGARSFKANNSKSQYLASLVDNYTTQLRLNETSSGFDTRATILENSLDRRESAPLKDNAFIRMLSRAQGSTYQAVTHFTLEVLGELDRDLSHKVRYVKKGSALPTVQAESENWGAQNRECIAATIIMQSLSAIMLDLMISVVNITSTNMTVDGKPVSRIGHSMSITGADVSSQLNLLLLRFEKEIMYDITFGNQDIYSLTVSMDLLGTSKIDISLGGGPSYPFVQASFADSLYVPVMTVNPSIKNNLVGDMEFILDSVSSAAPMKGPVNVNTSGPSNNDPGF